MDNFVILAVITLWAGGMLVIHLWWTKRRWLGIQAIAGGLGFAEVNVRDRQLLPGLPPGNIYGVPKPFSRLPLFQYGIQQSSNHLLYRATSPGWSMLFDYD